MRAEQAFETSNAILRSILDHYLHDDSTQISGLGTDEDRAAVSGVVLEG
jgi:hypothetical protein